jgi:hypothetical protein
MTLAAGEFIRRFLMHVLPATDSKFLSRIARRDPRKHDQGFFRDKKAR